MVFGDSENDVEMFEMVGIVYVMENVDDKVKVVVIVLVLVNS